MLIADTSIWIDHLRYGNQHLSELLQEGRVLGHHFVTGELACGSLKNRKEIISLLQALPQAPIVNEREIVQLIERMSLYGRGIGFVDANLIASAITCGCRIWTYDKKLHSIALENDIADNKLD
ncbi:MAG TPA: PIN domain-containing protein [Spirochaetota bacterium]|nr:PIN domain-containing protein [Spirochaetota bacterium]